MCSLLSYQCIKEIKTRTLFKVWIACDLLYFWEVRKSNLWACSNLDSPSWTLELKTSTRNLLVSSNDSHLWPLFSNNFGPTFLGEKFVLKIENTKKAHTLLESLSKIWNPKILKRAIIWIGLLPHWTACYKHGNVVKAYSLTRFRSSFCLVLMIFISFSFNFIKNWINSE